MVVSYAAVSILSVLTQWGATLVINLREREKSFTSYHGQLLSLAVQWGVAIEIERAVKKSARFC